MFRSLYQKLAAVLTGLFCVVGLVFLAAAIFSTKLYNQEVAQRLNRDLARQILAEKPLIRDSQVDKKALKEIFHALMIVNPGIEVYLLDRRGAILAFSAPEGKVKRRRVDVAPVEAWLAGDAKLPVLGEDPRNPVGEKVFSAARILENGEPQGYLYVILGGEIYDSVAETLEGSHILRLTVWMVVAGLLFALVAGLILFAVITGRLRRLSEAVKSFTREGGLDRDALPALSGKGASDEIDRLCETFGEMAARIEEQMERLRESDASRRELIANVSHDLRTPLSTLRGYLETLILKDEDMPRSRRRDYLRAAVKHCERLNRLISELLELAKYESCEIELSPEPFNLAELLSDTVQKFRLEAGGKNVELVAGIPDGLPAVRADIAMIERVLENLVENAIHHTPGGGEVRLDLTPSGDAVAVRVEDTGSGIPPADLPRIFERFYRSSRNRSADAMHSGLGLAISAKILQLHGREIKVESAPGKGAIFSFSLEAA